MTSKILFVVLVACAAAAFGSPIKRDQDTLLRDTVYDEQLGEISVVASLLKRIFSQLVQKISGTITDSLETILERIGERLTTKEFKDALEELKEIFEKVFNEDDEIEANDENKRIIEQEMEKVAIAFQKLLEDAIEKMRDENNNEKTDATEFKKAVDELKKLVDEIFTD